MKVGDTVINALTKKKCTIVGILDRNYAEKVRSDFDKIPILAGLSFILREVKTGYFDMVYEWEVSPILSKGKTVIGH